MRKKIDWSYYEELQAVRFIYALVQKYGYGLDQTECEEESWIAYFETRKEFEKDLANYEFWNEVENSAKEKMDRIRRNRSNKIRIMTKISLNMRVGESREELWTLLPLKNGDFTKSVDFWLFVKGLGKIKTRIITFLVQGEEDYDIMNLMKMNRNEFYKEKIQIGKLLEDYYEEYLA